MKNYILAGVAVAALVAAPAIAQFQGESSERGVTRAQIETRVEAAFARIDADDDGAITEDEAGEAHAAMREQRMEHRAERRENRAENSGDRFDRFDADGNGAISREEFDAHVAERAEHRAERIAARGAGEHRGMRGMHGLALRGERFEHADSDGDGRVTLDEATGAAIERFDAADANRDGTLTREERREAREARRAARG